ncbi:MAG: hypothetical protein ACRDG9_10180 [Actinomycetota bacterium]
MAAFIIRRLIWTIPVILLVILMTFVMMKQIGGNPFRRSERPVPPQVQENLERKFGLDEPWYVQYLTYVKNTFTFDFGGLSGGLVRGNFDGEVFSGTFTFTPVEGDCVTAAATKGRVQGEGILTS